MNKKNNLHTAGMLLFVACIENRNLVLDAVKSVRSFSPIEFGLKKHRNKVFVCFLIAFGQEVYFKFKAFVLSGWEWGWADLRIIRSCDFKIIRKEQREILDRPFVLEVILCRTGVSATFLRTSRCHGQAKEESTRKVKWREQMVPEYGILVKIGNGRIKKSECLGEKVLHKTANGMSHGMVTWYATISTQNPT